MYSTINRCATHLARFLALSALALGCAPTGPSPAQQAQFAQQYLAKSAPADAITLAELWQRLTPAEPASPGSTPPNPQPPAAETQAAETQAVQTPAVEAPAAEAPVAEAPAAEPLGSDGRLKLALKARLATPSPDLAAALPLYPWDDQGAAFYVTELGEHGHAGHDDNCPFCQARKAKAGAMGQLVKVALVDAAGQRLAQDIRPLLKLTGSETLYLSGSARRLPSGLVELEASQLYIDRAAQP